MRFAAVLLTIAGLAACTSRPSETSKEPVRRYSLHGEVVRLDANLAVIKGAKIEGWMESMTMEYPVKNAQQFAALHPGDCIDAAVFVQGTNFWIDEIKHQEAAPGACVSTPAEPRQ